MKLNSQSYHEEGDVAQKTTPVGPDIKNKTFAGEASWQNILAVNNKLSNTRLVWLFFHCFSVVCPKFVKDFDIDLSKYCLFDLFSAIMHKRKEIRRNR